MAEQFSSVWNKIHRAVSSALWALLGVVALAFMGRSAHGEGFDPRNPPENVIAGNEILGIISEILEFILFLAGALVIVGLVLAGIRYLTAGAEEEKASKAKQHLKYWLIGAAIVIGFSIIISTLINVVGGDFFEDSSSLLVNTAIAAEHIGIDSADDVVSIFEEVQGFILNIAFILISIYIVLSGIAYLTAGDDETKAKEAKRQFKFSLIGAVIIIGVMVIVRTLEAIISAGSIFP